MGLTIDEVIATNIRNFVECFELTKDDGGLSTYSCRIDGCDKKYPEKSSAIRHLRKNHKGIHDIIKSEKLSMNNVKNANSSYSFEIRVKVNPGEIMDACTELITVHGLPVAAVEYPAFKKILNPYVMALKTKGVDLLINQRTIKTHITKRTDELKKIIKKETNRRMVSIMVDIASRYNRSVLGVTIAYIYGGEIRVRTIAMRVLKASHTGDHISNILKEILSTYGIRLSQIVSITSDNGKNIVKAVALIDAYYQSHKNSTSNSNSELIDDDDEYYINPDVFDEEYYDEVLQEVRARFEGACSSDLISGLSCAAHCIHLVVSHAMDNSPEISEVIKKCRALAKKLRTPTFRSKLKGAGINMAMLDVETRWNSMYSMVMTKRTLFDVSYLFKKKLISIFQLVRLVQLKQFCDENSESLNETEWDQVQNIITILEPFNKYSKKLQSKNVTLSDFFGYWIMLRIKLSKVKKNYI